MLDVFLVFFGTFWTLFKTFWPYILLLVLLRFGPYLYEQWRLGRAGLPQIDRMTGLEFEKYLEILFKRLGYQVERTRYVGDQGGDLVLLKNGERILVQAKRHSKAIGNKAVQEAAAARPHYKCHRAMVVANQEFTRPARELAASNQVELWGRKKLTELILSLQAPPESVAAAAQPPAASPPTAPVSQPVARRQAPAPSTPTVQTHKDTAPTCTRCGRPMVLRESARGKFWGCSGFPKCRNIVAYQE